MNFMKKYNNIIVFKIGAKLSHWTSLCEVFLCQILLVLRFYFSQRWVLLFSVILINLIPRMVFYKRNFIDSSTFRAFNKITDSQRIPNFSFAASTNQNSELRIATLGAIAIKTNKWMCICRHHLSRATSLTSNLPEYWNKLHFRYFDFSLSFYHSFNCILMNKSSSIDENLVRLKIVAGTKSNKKYVGTTGLSANIICW